MSTTPESFRVQPDTKQFDLESLDTSAPDDVDKDSAKSEFDDITGRLQELQIRLYAEHKHRILVVLQATDTGGKDSTIRSVFGPLNPQGVEVASFKKPTEEELAHDYLWRIHSQVPSNGMIKVFNRSHYEDVLVVRVHDIVPEAVWSKRYGHIADFERLLTDEGTTIIKIFLNLSKDEQKERLQDRLDRADKHWKFNVADLKERERWSDYREAFADMLTETSTQNAPWYVVPADQKWYRNLIVGRIMVDTLEKLNIEFPPAEPGLDEITID